MSYRVYDLDRLPLRVARKPSDNVACGVVSRL